MCGVHRSVYYKLFLSAVRQPFFYINTYLRVPIIFYVLPLLLECVPFPHNDGNLSLDLNTIFCENRNNMKVLKGLLYMKDVWQRWHKVG